MTLYPGHRARVDEQQGLGCSPERLDQEGPPLAASESWGPASRERPVNMNRGAATDLQPQTGHPPRVRCHDQQ